MVQRTERITQLPYDASSWLLRSKTLLSLGYPAEAIGDAVRSLGLVRAVRPQLSLAIPQSPGSRKLLVFALMTCHFHRARQAASHSNESDSELGPRLGHAIGSLAKSTDEEIGSRLHHAIALIEQSVLRTLIEGLMLACALWDALNVCKNVAVKFPLETWFAERHEYLEGRWQKVMRIPGIEYLRSNPEDFKYQVQSGLVVRRLYPWMNASMCQRSDRLLGTIKEDFSSRSKTCTIFKSPIRSHAGTTDGRTNVLGIVATADIAMGETVLQDDLGFSTTSFKDRCDYCCAGLQNIEPVMLLCCDVRFCSQKCAQYAQDRYHLALCGKDFSCFKRRIAGISHAMATETLLFIRILAAIRQESPAHPLQSSVIGRLTMISEGEDATSFSLSVCNDLLKIAQMFGINIFTDHESDIWVLLTILYRIRSNRTGAAVEGGSVGSVNLLHCFFNHSCDPNVGYASDNESVKTMIALRDIGKGEELFISYIEAPHLRSRKDRRYKLSIWIGGDCMCSKCTQEPDWTDMIRPLG